MPLYVFSYECSVYSKGQAFVGIWIKMWCTEVFCDNIFSVSLDSGNMFQILLTLRCANS